MPLLEEDTIIIGHSSACPVILHFMKVPIKQVILVAGFYQPLNDDGYSDLMLQDEEYGWKAIEQIAKDIVLINSRMIFDYIKRLKILLAEVLQMFPVIH